MKKIAGYLVLSMLAFALFAANKAEAAVAQTIKASKTSVQSVEGITVKFTAPDTMTGGTLQLSCPEGVQASVFFYPTQYTPGMSTVIPPMAPCGTVYPVSNGTAAPIETSIHFLNKTSVAQNVVLTYSAQAPNTSTPTQKKVTVKVAPALVANKTTLDSASPVRLTFGYDANQPSKLVFDCPEGASAFYTKGAVDLCDGAYSFDPAYGPFRPAYVDVMVSNSTQEPLSLKSRVEVKFLQEWIASEGPEITVKTPVYFTSGIIKSKDTAKLVMAFPAKTKGTVKLQCYEDPELEFGLSTSFAGKCNKEVAYAALPVNLSFTLTNDTDESRSVMAQVCAHINGATEPCVPFDALIDVRATPSVIDLLLGTFADAFISWKSRFGDPTDKLVKTSVYKRTSTPTIVVAPEGATYAIVRAWGAAGGAFGNDNWFPYFALQGAKTNFTPGGYGGFVAGKIPVSRGDRFTFSAGAGGTRGTHSGDNNDDPGTPGSATSVSFNGKQIMIAGGGAQFLHTVAPTLTIIAPSQGLAARLEKIRVEFSSGGSIYSGKTKAAGVTDAKRNEVVNIAKNSHGAPGMVTGGGGKVQGAWYVYPWFGNSYITALTGGTSWIDTTVVQNPTYFAGNPGNNTADKGAWEKYFRSSPRPGFPGYDAGHGGVVVEFWAPADVPEVCSNGATDWPDCTEAALLPELTLSASPSTVVLGQAVSLSWTSLNANTCTASSTAGAGTWSGSFATSGTQMISPTTIGDKTYGMTCTGQGGAMVSDSTVVTVSTGDVCSNGATNFPTCTIDVTGTCVNGADNPPLCTTGGSCSNGATNFPTCTTGGSCSNGATDWPACTPGSVASQGFTLGTDRDLAIKTLPRGSATSDVVTIPVNRTGSFVGTVSAGIGGRSAVWPALPDDVEVSYSINGSPFSTDPVSVDVPGSSNSFGVSVNLSKRIPDACGAAQTGSCRYYYVSVTGTDPLGVVPQDFMLLRIVQGSVNPTYQEQ